MKGIRGATCVLALAVMAPVHTVAQAREAWVDAAGVRLRYQVWGSGPAVLLVHGFAITPEFNWVASGVVDALAPSYTVIAPDLRGHGLSDKPHDPAQYGATFARDLVRLLDHLAIPRAHVVGYSMGAAIALQLLTSHPDRVRSAVLGGGGWMPPETPPPPFLMEWIAGLERAAGGEGTVAEVVTMPGWPPHPPDLVAALNRNDPRALLAVLMGGAGLAVSEAAVRANTRPVLALSGGDDPGAVAAIEAMTGVLPHLDVVRMPHANHVTALGQPLFAQAIADFLRAHP